MKRIASFALVPFLLLSVAACDSSTDLEEVDLVGRWDGVGPLQTSEDGQGLTVRIQSDAQGVISGTWIRRQNVTNEGVIAGGTKESGGVEFTLQAFPGPDPTFEGRLSSKHRMVGTFSPALAGGEAVFRRGSITP